MVQFYLTNQLIVTIFELCNATYGDANEKRIF
ncbi:Uncharacterised protein [Legionella parisiensis]|nr:Uncharacterised protein [Legionella parisiensis]